MGVGPWPGSRVYGAYRKNTHLMRFSKNNRALLRICR